MATPCTRAASALTNLSHLQNLDTLQVTQNIYDELQWRGPLADCTDPAVSAAGGTVPPEDTGLYHRMVLPSGIEPELLGR